MIKSSDGGARPYRSHRVRACDLCRKRKSRCTLDITGQACVMCRVAGIDCCYDEGLESPRKRARIEKSNTVEASSSSQEVLPHQDQSRPSGSRHAIQLQVAKDHSVDEVSDTAHIVGPILANDAQVVEQYMSPEDHTGNAEAPYNVYSNDSDEPILYTKVSRRRPGFRSNGSAGAQQRVILEQILGPFAEELVNLYFEKIHPSFPILDRRSLHHSENQSTLMCEIYAIALLYWDSSELLQKHPRPDMSYAWNLAVTALQEEYLSPGLSTIHSALIDLSGRPSLWLTGNLINSGRTVALAHSLGLNRNPRKWKISKYDQDIRIRLWWGIVVHDRWASFAHGVPPNITRTNYDVPLPNLDDLKSTGLSPQQYQSAEVFIALCRLSEILGDILPLIYDLQMNPHNSTSRRLKRLDVDLDQWEDSLPQWLHFAERKPSDAVISGSSSLQLGCLSVKLLICRIKLHEATQSPVDIEQLRYHRSECRKGAMVIVDFILALKPEHLAEFWLPYSGYHLNSTAILLLRCAIESDDQHIKESCLSSVKHFFNYLERVRKNEDWDVAEVCLKHCKPTILRMANSAQSLAEHTSDARPEAYVADNDNNNNFGFSDDSAGMPWMGDGMLEGFEFYMGDLWDNLGSGSEPAI